MANGRYLYTIFSSTDKTYHGKIRKPINWIFTPRAVASYEHNVDRTIHTFLQAAETRFADRNGPDSLIDFSEWFQYFAYDFVGDLTYC